METTWTKDYKTALLRTRGTGWRLMLINSITEHQEELFFDNIFDARSYAQNWLDETVIS
jgi:hypothetical protein